MIRDYLGKVVKYKARLLAKGYSQRYGVDYDEVYSTIARFESVKVIIAIPAQVGW